MKHTWVSHTVTPVEVYPDSQGDVQPLMDPELKEQCDTGNVAYGCIVCGEPLTNDTYAQDCLGETDEA